MILPLLPGFFRVKTSFSELVVDLVDGSITSPTPFLVVDLTLGSVVVLMGLVGTDTVTIRK